MDTTLSKTSDHDVIMPCRVPRENRLSMSKQWSNQRKTLKSSEEQNPETLDLYRVAENFGCGVRGSPLSDAECGDSLSTRVLACKARSQWHLVSTVGDLAATEKLFRKGVQTLFDREAESTQK